MIEQPAGDNNRLQPRNPAAAQPAHLDVVVVVAQRVLHTLVHVLAPRKVDHAVKPGAGWVSGRAGEALLPGRRGILRLAVLGSSLTNGA